MCAPSGETVKNGSRTCVFSNAATLMTFVPTDGALTAYSPMAPSLPAEATTDTPLLTSRVDAAAVGYWGHCREAPMLMFSTSAPSASARSIAAIMMSLLVDPLQPNTRYAKNVTPGATPVTPPAVAAFAPTMPATCVPCPLQSIGSGSGTGGVGGNAPASYASPTKS